MEGRALRKETLGRIGIAVVRGDGRCSRVPSCVRHQGWTRLFRVCALFSSDDWALHDFDALKTRCVS